MYAIKIRILLFLYFAGHLLLCLFWTAPGERLAMLDKADEEQRKRFLASLNAKVGDKL